jgi:hypothetical protein
MQRGIVISEDGSAPEFSSIVRNRFHLCHYDALCFYKKCNLNEEHMMLTTILLLPLFLFAGFSD